MQSGFSPAREPRTRYRHELRMLSYVTLDQANGGIVRNITHDGIAVQAVTAVRPRQQVRVRFELRYPRLRVDTRGEVVWSTFSGRCGIRFLNLPTQTVRQIDEWIFGNLLEGLSLPSDVEASIFTGHGLPQPEASALRSARLTSPSERLKAAMEPSSQERVAGVEDNLITSPGEVKVIPLRGQQPSFEDSVELSTELDWFSQPLSGRSLAWTVNALVVFAALLLFAVVFLSVTREAPRWPARMISGAAIMVTTLYWGFFKMFGGASLGDRLARLMDANRHDLDEEEDRFR